MAQLVVPDRDGRIDTPGGTVEWSAIDGSSELDVQASPQLHIVESSTGFLMMDLGDELTFWRSSGGRSWSRAEVPFDGYGAAYRLIGDQHWIVTSEPLMAWRSTDTIEWDPVALPTESGLGRWPAGPLYDVGGRALWFHSNHTGYWYSSESGAWEHDPMLIDPSSLGFDDTVGIDAWHAGFATRDGIVVGTGHDEISVTTAGASSRMPAPWAGAGAVITTVAGDRFVAFVGEQLDSAQSFEFYERSELVVAGIWTSADGVTWDGPSAPEFAPQPTHVLVEPHDDGIVVVTGDSIWTSTDGVSWVAAAGRPPGEIGVARMGDGAVLVEGGTGRVMISDDMYEWREVDASDVGIWTTEFLDLRTIGRHLQWRNRLLRRQRCRKGTGRHVGVAGGVVVSPTKSTTDQRRSGSRCPIDGVLDDTFDWCGRAAAHGGIVSSGAV